MNLYQTNLLIIALGGLALLLIALASCFSSPVLFVAGLLAFVAVVLVDFIFKRCPHCGKHLGRDSGIFCPHCGQKL